MEFKDYYRILDISKTASTDDIQRAYRKGARKYHPDINKDAKAEDHFKDINEANEVLSDPQKRKLYDQYGMDWEQGGKQPPGRSYKPEDSPEDERFSRTFHFGSDSKSTTAGDGSDFFNSLFGNQFTRDGGESPRGFQFDARGRSQEAELVLSLAEIASGGTRMVSFQTFEVDSSGGLHPVTRTLQVKIPRGIKSGSIIRLAGQGEKGVGNGNNGDLLLRVVIGPDPRFRFENYDLYTSVAISPWEAVLGVTVEIETLSGLVKLRIPPKTQNKKIFRLKNKGLPKKTGEGYLYVEVEIRIPESLDEQELHLFEELSRQSGFNPRGSNRQHAEQCETV